MSDTHPLARLETVALIAIGGFAGANLRFFATGVLSDVQAILVANVIGSAVLGGLVYEAQYADVLDRRTSLLFTTGFLSSLTTYSGFAFHTGTAGGLDLLAFVAGNYGLGFAGVLLGREFARRIGGSGASRTAQGERS